MWFFTGILDIHWRKKINGQTQPANQGLIYLKMAIKMVHKFSRAYQNRRPRKNWTDIIRRDLKDTDISWDEAEELVTDRAEWRQRVVQCTHLEAG